MAVTIVGVNTAATAGAVNITIPLPAGVATGDEVALWLKCKRAAGTNTSVTTPSGWAKVGGNSGEGVTLFQKLYSTTPPANVVVTFSNSDTHCQAQSIAWHGGLNDGAGSTIRMISFSQTAAGSGANTLPTQNVQHANSLLLTLYATAGAAVTVPAAQTSLAASTQAGPPALGVASGYEIVVTPGTIAGEVITLSAATALVLAQFLVIPTDAVNAFTPHWATPLGPFKGWNASGFVVFDTTGDYAYYVGQDDSVFDANVLVRKIQRSTFSVVASATLTGHRTRLSRALAQDATALYIGMERFAETDDSYIKILKSDLSIVHTGAPATNVEFSHHLRLGKPGTWSAGLLFSVLFSSPPIGSPQQTYYLVAWDSATGAVSSQTTIPQTFVDPGPPPNPAQQTAHDFLEVDNNGDLWLLSIRSSFTARNAVLTKITSGVTFTAPISLPSLFVIDFDIWSSLTYDPATHALIITSRGYAQVDNPSDTIARYDIATGTIVYNIHYSWGLNLTEQYAASFPGNGYRDFMGIPSIFTCWRIVTNFPEPSWARHPPIVQHNHVTGAVVRVFELPDDAYSEAYQILQSPENELWLFTRTDPALPSSFDEYIHKLDLVAAITDTSSQGWVSWAEMQIPPTQTAFHRPPYGRGYGLGYGGAGPYLHPGTGDQFGRPSADTFIGTYTDAAAGVTNIYQSLDEPTLNDADYITSVSAPSNAVYVTKLTPLTDPLISTGHIVRYRYKKEGSASVQLDLVVQLRQGYVNEGTLGTLIKEWTHADISTTFVTETQTLTGGEADTITDYTSLFKRFRFNQV